MNKKAVLISLFFLFCLLTSSARLGFSAVSSASSVDVGVFYYGWYKAGVGSDGMDSKYWLYPSVQDKPVKGFYDSSNTTAISEQIVEMRSALVDFAILSFWGEKSNTDNNSLLFFDCLRDNYTTLRACVMVEPFNGTESKGRYNYTVIYDYVYDRFVVPFESCYYRRLDGYGVSKPVICFYNADNFTIEDDGWSLDSRFLTRFVGHKPYVEWVYHDIVPEWRGNYHIPQTRQYPVCPRYDDKWLNRSTLYRYDIDYSEGCYELNLKEALRAVRNNTIDVVTVCSWNEYNERTQIEPCFDRDFTGANDYLLNMTREYVYRFKGLTYGIAAGGLLWYQQPFTFALVISGVCLIVLGIKRR